MRRARRDSASTRSSFTGSLGQVERPGFFMVATGGYPMEHSPGLLPVHGRRISGTHECLWLDEDVLTEQRAAVAAKYLAPRDAVSRLARVLPPSSSCLKKVLVRGRTRAHAIQFRTGVWQDEHWRGMEIASDPAPVVGIARIDLYHYQSPQYSVVVTTGREQDDANQAHCVHIKPMHPVNMKLYL